MALTPRDATCTALGTFNIYIFQPDWIATRVVEAAGRSDVEGATREVQATAKLLVDLGRPGLRLKAPDWSPDWTVRPDRLILADPTPGGGGTTPATPTDDDAPHDRSPGVVPDCGTVMAGVLRKLPETPVTAVGNTFRFAGPLADADPATNPHLPAGVFPGTPPTPDGSEPSSSGFGFEFDRDGATVTASFTRRADVDDPADALEVTVNYHRPAAPDAAPTAARFIAAAEHFTPDRAAATALLEELFHLSVSAPPSA